MTIVEGWILTGSAVFGAIIGSFLNVVICRLPEEGASIVRPRSMCVKCKKPLAWHDNIPILSYLILLGRCRHCSVRISPRYPMVEGITAALTLLLAYRMLLPALSDPAVAGFWYPTFAKFVVHAAFVYALIAATFIDFDHTIIPDEITKPGMVVALVAAVAVPDLHNVSSPMEGLLWAALGLVTGGGFIWLVRVGGRLVFRKEAMGFGDVKYMGLIGGILGWKGVFLTFFIACVFGSVIGVAVLLVRKSRYIPFAPFLSLGAGIMLLFSNEVYHFLSEDYPAFLRGLMGG